MRHGESIGKAENERKLIELIYEFGEWENCLLDGSDIGNFDAHSITAGIYGEFCAVIRLYPELAKKYSSQLMKMRKHILRSIGKAVL